MSLFCTFEPSCFFPTNRCGMRLVIGQELVVCCIFVEWMCVVWRFHQLAPSQVANPSDWVIAGKPRIVWFWHGEIVGPSTWMHLAHICSHGDWSLVRPSMWCEMCPQIPRRVWRPRPRRSQITSYRIIFLHRSQVARNTFVHMDAYGMLWHADIFPDNIMLYWYTSFRTCHWTFIHVSHVFALCCHGKLIVARSVTIS